MKTPKIPNIASGSYVPPKIQQQIWTADSRQDIKDPQYQLYPLSKLEYDLLDYIRTQRSPEWIQVLNAFDPQKQVNTVDALLKNLLDKGLIQPTSWPSSPPHCRVRLTPHGLSVCLMRLESVEHAKVDHEEHLRDKRQERKYDWKKIARALGWFVGLIAGLVAIIDFAIRVIG